MQNDLIMNHIPLPKYFDGVQWNTVIKPTRKSIPKYLHQDLPQLRHLYIKQLFKDMGKLNVPNLQFFNSMIKKKQKKTQKRANSTMPKTGRDKKYSYNQVKEEFQYALLVTDRNSNVIDELVEKAQKVEQSSIKRPRREKKYNNFLDGSRSRTNDKVKLTKQTTRAKYFQNTVDLVFRNRRNKYLESLKKPQEIDYIPEALEKRFKQLGLIDIYNPNL